MPLCRKRFVRRVAIAAPVTRPVGKRRGSSVVIGRRELLLGSAAAAAAALGTACSGTAASTPIRAPEATSPALVWSHFDLPQDDPRSRELSGAAWDAKEHVLWAVQDAVPRIVALVPDDELRTWKFGESFELDCGGPVDLEGLVIVPDGFIVSSEVGPRIIELDRKGRVIKDVAVPSRFSDTRQNRSLESLTIGPSGRYLFTTTEVALKQDGDWATREAGTRVRLLRIDRKSGVTTEHAYVTDTMDYDRGDWGVADLAALSDTELYVLERGWSRGHGNTVRIYRTELTDRASCGNLERLTPDVPTLAKTLVADLSKLAAPGFPSAKQPQVSPILDNYEGLAIGPRLGDRPSLILVSDDNGHKEQVARVLVLTI